MQLTLTFFSAFFIFILKIKYKKTSLFVLCEGTATSFLMSLSPQMGNSLSPARGMGTYRRYFIHVCFFKFPGPLVSLFYMTKFFPPPIPEKRKNNAWLL